MTRFAILLVALLLAAPAAAQEQAQPPSDEPGAPSAGLENLLENCDAHKFETTVDSVVDGQPHRSKVKMCGKEGQSDADWIGTLEDAIAKLDANNAMPESTRDQIVSAIKSEIARLNGDGGTNPNAALPPGRPASKAPDPLSNDYTLLPPLKTTPPPPPRLLPPTAQTAPATSVVTPPAAASGVSAAPPVPPKPVSANPHLRLSCMNAEFPGGGPCVTLTRDTILTVRAPAAVADSLSLRFVRQGQARAEVAVGPMRKGQSIRLALPQGVCSGVVTGEVVLQVVGGGQVLDRQGPYLLHC